MSEWISVKDRLPPILFCRFLVCCLEGSSRPFIGRYVKDNHFDWTDDEGREIVPSHWMLLPEPPNA
jgi:hypothetical protein